MRIGVAIFSSRIECARAQDFFVVAFGKDNLLGFSLSLVNHHARDLVGLALAPLELFAVFVNVDGLLSHARFHRGLGHG